MLRLELIFLYSASEGGSNPGRCKAHRLVRAAKMNADRARKLAVEPAREADRTEPPMIEGKAA
jgi:hypothetical protein